MHVKAKDLKAGIENRVGNDGFLTRQKEKSNENCRN